MRREADLFAEAPPDRRVQQAGHHAVGGVVEGEERVQRAQALLLGRRDVLLRSRAPRLRGGLCTRLHIGCRSLARSWSSAVREATDRDGSHLSCRVARRLIYFFCRWQYNFSERRRYYVLRRVVTCLEVARALAAFPPTLEVRLARRLWPTWQRRVRVKTLQH